MGKFIPSEEMQEAADRVAREFGERYDQILSDRAFAAGSEANKAKALQVARLEKSLAELKSLETREKKEAQIKGFEARLAAGENLSAAEQGQLSNLKRSIPYAPLQTQVDLQIKDIEGKRNVLKSGYEGTKLPDPMVYKGVPEAGPESRTASPKIKVDGYKADANGEATGPSLVSMSVQTSTNTKEVKDEKGRTVTRQEELAKIGVKEAGQPGTITLHEVSRRSGELSYVSEPVSKFDYSTGAPNTDNLTPKQGILLDAAKDAVTTRGPDGNAIDMLNKGSVDGKKRTSEVAPPAAKALSANV